MSKVVSGGKGLSCLTRGRTPDRRGVPTTAVTECTETTYIHFPTSPPTRPDLPTLFRPESVDLDEEMSSVVPVSDKQEDQSKNRSVRKLYSVLHPYLRTFQFNVYTCPDIEDLFVRTNPLVDICIKNQIPSPREGSERAYRKINLGVY